MEYGIKSKLAIALCRPESRESERTNHNYWGLVVPGGTTFLQIIQLQEPRQDHSDHSTLNLLLSYSFPSGVPQPFAKNKLHQELAPKTVFINGILYAAVLGGTDEILL
jgi:hypothetical protein